MAAATLTPAEVDRWPLVASGLSRRVIHQAGRAGLQTVGALRAQLAAGKHLPGIGPHLRRQVETYCSRTATPLPVTMRAWLGTLLTPAEQKVIELRYGLTDPLWRPTMRFCTLREIAETRGVTRGRVQRMLQRSRRRLHTALGRALAQQILVPCLARLAKEGPPVPVTELRAWRGAPWLGGYQPWGALVLLGEVTGRPAWQDNYFTAGAAPA